MHNQIFVKVIDSDVGGGSNEAPGMYGGVKQVFMVLLKLCKSTNEALFMGKMTS